MILRGTQEPAGTGHVVVVWEKTKLPEIFCPKASRKTPLPEICSCGVAGRSRMRVSPPTRNSSSTGAPVLLILTLNVPPTLTPGMFTATLADSSPANPAGLMRKRPVPSVTTTKSVVPSPSRSSTLAAAILSTVCGAGGGCPGGAVSCLTKRSNEKSPRSVWPATVRAMSSPSIRRYGPPGRSSVNRVSPTWNASRTGVVRLLIEMRNVPVNSNPVTENTGVTAIDAARPPGESTMRPSPPVSCNTPSTRFSSTLARPMRTTLTSSAVPTNRSGPAVVACSKAKSPVSRKAPPSTSTKMPTASTRR